MSKGTISEENDNLYTDWPQQPVLQVRSLAMDRRRPLLLNHVARPCGIEDVHCTTKDDLVS